jgi:hypothetical protein
MSGRMAWGFDDGNHINLYPSGAFCWNTSDGAETPFKNDAGTSIGFTPYHGNWHHYAVTGDGAKTLLYIDGVFVGTAIKYKPVTGKTLVLSGWKVNNANYRWSNGYLSDFRIYSTPLSASDVKDLYNAPIEIDNLGNIFANEIYEI